MAKKRKRGAASVAREQGCDREAMYREAERLAETFAAYGVEGRVTEITPGPVVTTYEFMPSLGTRMSKIVALAPQIVRINAPIPGKFAVGIDVVNVKT
jgi:S-DNA-T family DNA segregation ATPase FtsK/SpoIIIE